MVADGRYCLTLNLLLFGGRCPSYIDMVSMYGWADGSLVLLIMEHISDVMGLLVKRGPPSLFVFGSIRFAAPGHF